MSDTLVKVGFGLLVVGFLLMASAFGKLFRQAWRRPERRTAVKQVLHLQPGSKPGWPNSTREALVVGIGALAGALGCILLLVAGWLFRSGR